MKRRTFLSLVMSMLAAGASGLPGGTTSSAEESQMGQMSNAFAIDLYHQLAGGQGNLFFSPTSIQTALAMTWAGARGATADEMAKTLDFAPKAEVNQEFGGFLKGLNADGQKGGYQLSVANALWGPKSYPFMPAYLNLVKKEYDGNLSDLNFAADPDAARKTINDWVASQTHDRIKDLLPAGTITPMTRLVLTNAIYFKGAWDQPFKKEQTKDDQFNLADGKKIKAPFMFQKSHFRYAEGEDVQVLEMTYGHNDLAMRIYLPRKADGLGDFEKQMTADKMAALAGKLQREEVNVALPKVTMESQFSLADTLQAMGMKLAFNPDRADFKGMTTAEKVFISDVIHKAFVKVDEAGTEAAAATAVTMRTMAMRLDPEKPKAFRADHPFVFEIVHQKSGAVLFMGRVATVGG